MIKFTATNVLVHSVSQTIEIPSKSGGQSFFKRELIIDESWDKDGKHYPNFVLIEFSGDKLSQLDYIFPGQRVNVEGMLSGREYNGRIFNSIKGLSVIAQQMPQQFPPAPVPMPGGYTQQAQYTQSGFQQNQMPGGYPAAPAYPQQQQQYAPSPAPGFPPAPAASSPAQQPFGSSPYPGEDDLPF